VSRILRIWLAACLLGALASAVAIGQSGSSPDRIERKFVSGGKVYLDLSAGAYRVEGTPDKAIRMRWRTSDQRDLGRVRANVEVKGANATVYLSGPGNNFGADIELPARTDLTLRLSAGDLKVRGLEGNKDVDLWAGDVTIEVGEPQRYRKVDATVRMGQITAMPFNQTKGGLFRSIGYTGQGPYELRVRLFAGDLKLVR
jgi:hypothetical protein